MHHATDTVLNYYRTYPLRAVVNVTLDRRGIPVDRFVSDHETADGRAMTATAARRAMLDGFRFVTFPRWILGNQD